MAETATLDRPSVKREKFVTLGEKRMANAIKAIRLVGQLGNRNAYEFSDLDVKKMMNTLSDEVEAARTRMTAPKRAQIMFKL